MHEEQHHFQAEVHFDLHVGVGFADNGDSNGVYYMRKIDGFEHRIEWEAAIITGVWQMNRISTTYPASQTNAYANGDGTVDILDLVWIIDQIVGG